MLTDFMHFMSFLGSAAFYLPVLVVLFWCVAPRLAARVAVILLFGGFLNGLLKLVFHDPRPYWTDPSVKGRESLSSFGMPSGHSQNAPVFWGFFAVQTRRWYVWTGAAAIVFLVGVSRVYLGVHSVGQVLGGWAIGIAILVAALGLEPIVVPWWTRRHLAVQAMLALAISLVLLAAAWGALRPLQGWHWPGAWVHAIHAAGGHIEPLDLVESAKAAGGLFGVLAGLSLLAARGWFDPGGDLWRRFARVPVGVAGAAIVSLFGGTHLVQAFIVQAVLGLWVTAGAPEAFVRLGLASRSAPALTRPGEGREERADRPQ
ncbi:phosphatase PAP2 family protein [Actinomadura decatromicini]|uniref:Phosphatase PAP2 family protein n=1 Tax=Actinomadura decatromicini TaxID=2604572 RepID=A0A5D3FIV9_9ACTN|nr:phosphatase PAP2 family protein [Actinomadura decatromicini]TYK47912.1 phosphatase PAP2 family protein [Actinomadura decatromicini]